MRHLTSDYALCPRHGRMMCQQCRASLPPFPWYRRLLFWWDMLWFSLTGRSPHQSIWKRMWSALTRP